MRAVGRPYCVYCDRLERPRGAVDGVGQTGRHRVEEGADLRRHQDDGGDDEDRDQRHDEGVLDRVGAALVLEQGRDEALRFKTPHGYSSCDCCGSHHPSEVGPRKAVPGFGNTSPRESTPPPAWLRARNALTLCVYLINE